MCTTKESPGMTGSLRLRIFAESSAPLQAQGMPRCSATTLRSLDVEAGATKANMVGRWGLNLYCKEAGGRHGGTLVGVGNGALHRKGIYALYLRQHPDSLSDVWPQMPQNEEEGAEEAARQALFSWAVTALGQARRAYKFESIQHIAKSLILMLI